MLQIEDLKNKKLVWPIFLLILFIIGLAVIFLFKNRMFLNKRTVDLEVFSDGSIKVEEIWDIDVKNTSTLFITYPIEEKTAFKDVSVSYWENGYWKPMIENYAIYSDGKEPLNRYHAGVYEGSYEIAWGTGLAEDKGNRKYKIEYTKEMTFIDKNSVNLYLDTAELYHKLVGNDFKIPTKEFKAMIKFPQEVNLNNAKIWGHGAKTGKINFKDGGVEVLANDVSHNVMVEVRAVFPKEFLFLAQTNKKTNGYNSILKEEGINTDKTSVNNNFENDESAKIVVFALLFVVFYAGFIIFVFRTYKKAKAIPEGNVRKWEVYSGLPESKLDIIAANVIYEPTTLSVFVNTIIMKLSHKKYLNIIKTTEYDGSLLEKNKLEQENRFFLALQTFMENSISEGETNIDTSINEEGLREAIKSRREFDEILSPKLSRISKEKVNELRYVLDLKKYREDKLAGKVDEDEKIVMDFLITSVSNSYIKSTSESSNDYTTKYVKELRKLAISYKKSEWKKLGTSLKGKLETELDELHIEQYQIVLNMFFYGDKLSEKYDKAVENRRNKFNEEGIYSKEKFKLQSVFAGVTGFRIFILIFIIFGVLNRVFGTMEFNRTAYLIVLVAAMIFESILAILGREINKKIDPTLGEKGLNIYYEFQGLKKFLSTTSYISEYDEKSIIIWGEFLVLATYFSLTDKILQTLKQSHPEIMQEMASTPAFITMNNAIYSYSAFSSATSTSYSSFSSSASSGGGGGFSGGGGGGGRRWPEVADAN